MERARRNTPNNAKLAFRIGAVLEKASVCSSLGRYSAALSFTLAIASSTEGRSMANTVSGVTTA